MMRFALSIPNFGDYADARTVATLAREAEDAGWDGFFVWDHLLAWNANVVGDPWTILTAVALATERVRIGPMITPLARRRPWVLARQVVTLDRVSNGRLTLGAGLGFPPREEFEVFGEPGDDRTRGETLDEALAVLTGLLTGEPFSHDGARFHVEGVTFLPTCVQTPRIPIWVGGSWPTRAPFRRAARFEGVVPISVPDEQGEVLLSIEQMRDVVAFVRGERHGADGRFDAVFTGFMPEDRREAAEMSGELASFGVTWWQVSPGPGEDRGVFEEWIREGPPTV